MIEKQCAWGACDPTPVFRIYLLNENDQTNKKGSSACSLRELDHSLSGVATTFRLLLAVLQIFISASEFL
jgi:hypothetical protein